MRQNLNTKTPSSWLGGKSTKHKFSNISNCNKSPTNFENSQKSGGYQKQSQNSIYNNQNTSHMNMGSSVTNQISDNNTSNLISNTKQLKFGLNNTSFQDYTKINTFYHDAYHFEEKKNFENKLHSLSFIREGEFKQKASQASITNNMEPKPFGDPD